MVRKGPRPHGALRSEFQARKRAALSCRGRAGCFALHRPGRDEDLRPRDKPTPLGKAGGIVEGRLSGISCVGGHDGWKGAQRCPDANSLIFLMPSWTSCWLGPIPRRPLIRTVFLTA